jgi:hypothetical protein
VEKLELDGTSEQLGEINHEPRLPYASFAQSPYNARRGWWFVCSELSIVEGSRISVRQTSEAAMLFNVQASPEAHTSHRSPTIDQLPAQEYWQSFMGYPHAVSCRSIVSSADSQLYRNEWRFPIVQIHREQRTLS